MRRGRVPLRGRQPRLYESTSLKVTINLPFEHWTEVLGNERLTGALLERVTHRLHILGSNGDNLRLRDGMQQPQRKVRKPPKTRRLALG
jgi:hypothetical protein